MSSALKQAVSNKGIHLKYVELNNFRRLGNVQFKVDSKNTILVGANNSGKTSILAAIRNFLAKGSRFSAFDISISQWSKLRDLGKEWEALTEDPLTVDEPVEKWGTQLQRLLETMPTLDLWFNADVGMYHYVAPFLSTFTWQGGAVGVRLRLEPASDINELKQLAWDYCKARAPLKEIGEDSSAWPIDLLDFWLQEPSKLGQVCTYKLNSQNNPITEASTYVAQKLDIGRALVDRKHLSKLIRVDFIAAQRGFGSEEADSRSTSGLHKVGMFSNQLIKFAQQHLNIASSGHGQRPDLIKAIAQAQKELDTKIQEALNSSIEEVKELGYPSLHDPQNIRFRTRIQAADLLDHGTAVQYGIQKDSNEEHLPEHSIGLGYQNLQSLSYQLVSFRSARLNPDTGAPAPVHLVMIEEPEAHLHVQVQRIFPSKAHNLITPPDTDASSLNSQLLISTHSSHLALSENFDRLRYVRRIEQSKSHLMPATEIINLAEVFGDDNETRQFAERYFRVQHTDLLFANAAIFVEGVAERMLVPLFIEQEFQDLNSRYISFLDIGGSHAHRLRPLIEKLKIPTVIITDIDPCEEVEGKPTKKGEPRTTLKAVSNKGQAGLKCGNPTLRGWHPKLNQLDDFKSPKRKQLVWDEIEDCRVYFAWQLPIKEADGCWPSTFEDSLVLTNTDWFKKLMVVASDHKPTPPKGALGSVVRKAVDTENHQQLLDELHKLMHGSFNKGDFSASIFELISNGEKVKCPKYIADALAWLQKELEPNGGKQ